MSPFSDNFLKLAFPLQIISNHWTWIVKNSLQLSESQRTRVSNRNSIARNCAELRATVRNCAQLWGVYRARNCAQIKSAWVGNPTKKPKQKKMFLNKRDNGCIFCDPRKVYKWQTEIKIFYNLQNIMLNTKLYVRN